MDKAKAAAIVGIPIAALLGYSLWKKEETKEQVQPAPQVESRGTPVLIPWMNEYVEQSPISIPVSGGGAVQPSQSEVVVKQPVRVREEAYKEILPLEGTAADTYTTQNTYELSNMYQRFDILTEGGDVLVSLRTANGRWTVDIPIPEGFGSFDFALTGMKIKNRVSGTSVNYYINLYRW